MNSPEYITKKEQCKAFLHHMGMMLQDLPDASQDMQDETFITCMMWPTLKTIHEITEQHFSDKGEK